MNRRVAIVFVALGVLFVIGASMYVQQPRPKLPPDLAFLERYDSSPELVPFHAYAYHGKKLVFARPALRLHIGSRQQELARDLKKLKGWNLVFPQVGSFHAEARQGGKRLQFFANYGVDSFVVYEDDAVVQPPWRVWLYGLTHPGPE